MRPHLLAFVIGMTLAGATATADAASYYLDPSGSDQAAGTSPSAAWASLGRLNSVALRPGDRVLLRGGATFPGTLRLGAADSGSRAMPVRIGSFGTGRAVIAPTAASHGIEAVDTAGFIVENLVVLGRGPATSRAAGIVFHSRRKGRDRLDFVTIRNVEVAGFRQGGVVFEADDFAGFSHVLLDHVVAHDDGDVGIKFAGRYVQVSEGDLPYSHQDVLVTDSAAYRNLGDPQSDANTGSGILLGQVDGGVVEYCTAHDNGGSGVNANGGPVGIWTYDSTRITIQHNESWNNRTGNANDGGGFDLDGGTSNAVVQYNYSHGNDGAGYLLTQFATARRFRNNLIRFNISENDGRANGYAGILSFADATTTVEDTRFENNTIYVGAAKRRAAAVRFFEGGGGYRGTALRNNIFVAAGGSAMLDIPMPAGITFQGNLYWSTGGALDIAWGGRRYASLSSWRAASGEERVSGRSSGLQADPMLRAAGQGGTNGDPRHPGRIGAYRLGSGSPAIDSGLDLKQLFAETPGPIDYFGSKVGAPFDIGAASATR